MYVSMYVCVYVCMYIYIIFYIILTWQDLNLLGKEKDQTYADVC
jgi:hypothetical protein